MWAGLGSIFGLQGPSEDVQATHPANALEHTRDSAGDRQRGAGASAGDKIDLTHLSSQSSKEACHIISSDSSQEADEATRGSARPSRRPKMLPHLLYREREGGQMRLGEQDHYLSGGELSDSREEQASMSSNTTPRVARAGGCPRVRRQHPYEDGRDGQIEDCGLCAVSQRLPSISTSGSDLPDDIPDATDLSQDAGARVVHAATALAAGGAAADSRGTARAPLFRTYARCKISSPAPQEPAGNGSVCSAKDRQPVPRTEETPLEACAGAGGGSGWGDGSRKPATLRRREFGGVFTRAAASADSPRAHVHTLMSGSDILGSL